MFDELLARIAVLRAAVNDAAAATERPAESKLSMAVRSTTAAVCLSHRELSDSSFLCLLTALTELADATGCTYYFGRQVLRSCRDDPHLVSRLAQLMETAELLAPGG